MYSVCLKSPRTIVRDLEERELPRLLAWYNDAERFGYATGLDSPVSHEYLAEMYKKTASSDTEILAGIYTACNGTLVGVLKGRLITEGAPCVWISLLAIDPGCRGRGYARDAVGLLLTHLKEQCGIERAYLAIAEENQGALAFWSKLGFAEIRRMKTGLVLYGKPVRAVIMGKRIEA